MSIHYSTRASLFFLLEYSDGSMKFTLYLWLTSNYFLFALQRFSACTELLFFWGGVFLVYTALLHRSYKLSFLSSFFIMQCLYYLWCLISLQHNRVRRIFLLFVFLLAFLHPCLISTFFTFITMRFLQKHNWCFKKIRANLSSFACDLMTYITSLCSYYLCLLHISGYSFFPTENVILIL